MKRQLQMRQGDVFVERVRALPNGLTPVAGDRIILAEGEVTGHAHEVQACAALDPVRDDVPPAQLFEAPDGTRYLLVDRPCTLTHQEHAPIALAPGAYKVVRQREYSPEAIRQVAD